MTKYLILFSFFGIWISHFIDKQNQIILGFILIITFGILHGCNDLILIAKENNYLYNIYNLLAKYILVLFAFSVLFYNFKVLGFLIFILISAYHFGEQHLPLLKNNNFKYSYYLFRFSYGFSILSILMSFHATEVSEIIFEMITYKISEIVFKFIVAITILSDIVLYFINKKLLKNNFNELFEIFLLLLFTMIFKLTPLIWGFSLYFIIWHSIPSIKSQCEYLYNDFTLKTLLYYIKAGIATWVVSVIVLLFYFIFLNSNIMIETILFCFIAAITFPHVLTIFYLFNKKTE
ncbi:Brp/Blh family beta-carotene 15,15'-dioxygenase [Flavobacterium sp.]|uniref:Brp/Blh family beta-carotene 15,15'-dioxygenase n=1 Tax=Flavobacterium sp. TaxID=239 RepID=UPI003D2963D6